MVFIPPAALASIDGARPVFLMVMAISLLAFTWRLSSKTSGWAPRLMKLGSLMLGLGYGVLMPAYDAGLIERITSNSLTDPASAIVWHAFKLVLMNSGWFALGLGLALHAKIFSPATPRKQAIPQIRPQAIALPARESAA